MFKFGGQDFTILNHVGDYVPTKANEVILGTSDKKAIATGIAHDLPILLIGEAGTGKTSIARFIAHKRKQGYTRISMTGYSTPDELIGSKSVKDGATYYENGILTKAMIDGHIVVLDEINATPPDCLFILHSLLDDDKRLALPNGDIIKPHKDFRFIATMNPDYEGTKGLNRALLDRFSIILSIDTLKPIAESKLLVKRTGIDKELADKMIVVAWSIRKAYVEQRTLSFCSTRTLLQWGELIKKGLPTEQAYKTAIINKAQNADDKKAFREFYSAVFKTAIIDDLYSDEPVLTTKRQITLLKNEANDWRKYSDDIEAELNKAKDKIRKLEKQVGSPTTKSKTTKKQVFEVGTRVIARKALDNNDDTVGKEGTIIYKDKPRLVVEFDEEIERGHEGCHSKGKDGHCWNYTTSEASEYLEVI